MEGLQRSSETFRRSGSSGMVWEDRFLPGEMKKKEEEAAANNAAAAAAAGGGGAAAEFRELRPSRSTGSAATMERSQSNGGRGYRTGRVSPALDPPSPKVSVCGFCGIFKKPKPAAAAGGGGAAAAATRRGR